MKFFRPAVFAAAASCAIGSASADDLFSITAVGSGTVTATGDSVLDLYEDAIETTGAFSSLSGSAVVSTLNYAGVADAVRITVNAAGTSATLEFPGLGFARVFAGTDANNLADQIEDFIQDDGAEVYADFLEQIREQSVAAVLDGNPFSTTAIGARHLFDLYGLGVSGPEWANPGRFQTSPDSPKRKGPTRTIAWFEVTPSAGGVSAGPFDGFVGGVDVAGGAFVNKWLGFAAGGSFQYLNVEGTDIGHAVGHFAVPMKLVPVTQVGGDEEVGTQTSFGLQLTPFFSGGSGGSLDAAAGGSFVGGGVAANVHLGLGDRVSVNWGSQIVAYEGIDSIYDDFEFETELSQSIFSTGLVATVFIDQPGGNVFIDGGISYFTFLNDAAVDYWISPEVGVGVRIYRDSRVRASYRPSFGNAGYEAHQGSLNLVFAF